PLSSGAFVVDLLVRSSDAPKQRAPRLRMMQKPRRFGPPLIGSKLRLFIDCSTKHRWARFQALLLGYLLFLPSAFPGLAAGLPARAGTAELFQVTTRDLPANRADQRAPRDCL